MAKRMIAALLALTLLCGVLPACAEEPMNVKTVPLYVMDLDTKYDIELVFLNGQEDLPYVTAQEMCRVMNLIWHDVGEDDGFDVSLLDAAPYTVLVRENEASVYIDYEQGLLGFSQYDRFFASSDGANMLDIVVTGGTGEGANLIQHNSAFACGGNYSDLNLREYDIPTPIVNGTGYLPLQTFSDVFIAPSGAALCFNGEMVAAAGASSFTDSLLQLTPLGELYFSVPKRLRSDALAQFTVSELCLAMDIHYGLKEEHGIGKFSDYLIRSGLLTDLLDPDAKTSGAALYKLCAANFADGHSGLRSVSPYTEYGDQLLDFDSMSVDMFKKLLYIGEYYGARANQYPDGMPGYEEVGNTAYVTFDSFTMDLEKDYYGAENAQEFNAETADTVELLIYANSRIHRENSPVENVVIDLSCNSGGYVDVAMCVCAWMLGMGSTYIEDTFNGATGSNMYMFDANLDHVYDSAGDSVNGKNLFCLISPVSFSCGNLVPASLKSSGSVTVLGKTSTGGACAVQTLSLADGTLMCVSGRLRINTVNNGIFYSVDAGVEPQYYLPKSSMFYDREKLTDYINGLMW